MVAVPADVVGQYPRFTLYNSPYRAHRRGRAIDLYPSGDHAPSPVAGTVERSRRLSCPDRPYAAAHDHLLVIDTGSLLARVLHVRPAVEVGEAVSVGQDLGQLVRSGYFARWVDNHLHLGFRDPEDDPLRASGSLPLTVDVPIEAVSWDGTGRVVETGDTYAVLDSPTHPRPGATYAAIADDTGTVALDGGLPHYDGGGAISGAADGSDTGPSGSRTISGDSRDDSTTDRPGTVGQAPASDDPRPPTGESRGSGLVRAPTTTEADPPGPIRLLGTTIGERDGRDVEWGPVSVLANGRPVTGLSFVFGLERLSAKLICPETAFQVGESVRVEVVRETGHTQTR
ncbi:MAG: hypothetical protein ABEJ27_07365 [Halodesulfurarchaeum sp.]